MSGFLFPLVARAFGIIASIIGVMIVKCREDQDPMDALNRGYYVTAVLAAIGFGATTYFMLNEFWVTYFIAGIIGIVTSVLFALITQYYTEHKYRPVKSIAESSQTGAATNIITGFAVGLESVWLPPSLTPETPSIKIRSSHPLNIGPSAPRMSRPLQPMKMG